MSPTISPDLEAPAEIANARTNRNSARETIALARVIRKGKHERKSSFVGSHVDLLGRSTHSDMDTLTEEYQEVWQRQEKERRKKRCYIILHNGKPRLTWDGCLAIILCILSFYIPYRVCFFWEQESYDEESILIFESVIDCIFALDIILNFLTTYTDEKTSMIVTSPRRIAWKYLRGFFFIDLIATVPFGYILTTSSFAVSNKLGKLGRLPKLVKFVRAARLLKLLRVYRLHDFIVKLEVQLNIHQGYSRMLKIVILILLVTHMVGCFWYLIGITGKGAEDDDLNSQGWVYRYYLDSSPRWRQYIASMYWSFSTLTTVGYGDISARTPQEQTFSMFMMLIGVTWYAFIVSSISTIMSSFDAQNKAFRDKMLCVNEFVRTTRLPTSISKQVRDFFEFKTKCSYQSSNYNVDELLGEMGSTLRADIMLHLQRNLIEKVPFFKGKVPQFVADCVSMFSPMVFYKGDFIVKEGTQADEMYFLTEGKAGIFYGSKLIAVIDEGSYFGEVGVILGGIRRAGVKALMTCEVQALSKRNLNILLEEYPAVADELRQVAKERASIASKGGKSASFSSTSDECESHDAHDKDNKAKNTSASAALELEIDRLVESISKLRKELRGGASG